MQAMQNVSTQKKTNKSTLEMVPFGNGITSQTKLTIARLFMLASVFGLAWLVTTL